MTTLLVEPGEMMAQSLSVEGESHRHLFRALRLAEGARVRVVDGRGAARWGTVAVVRRRSAEIELGEAAPTNESERSIEVFVAPPKIGRASWMVEKLTEIGVGAVRLWATERGPRAYGRASLERLQRVAAAAVEQCERSRVPEIETLSWDGGVERLVGFDRRWLLTPGAAPAPERTGGERDPIAVLVGPEGGFSDVEREALAALPSVQVGLGPTVLRVETAAVIGAALALAR